MKKIVFIVALIIATGVTALSQEKTEQGAWTRTSEVSFTFSQVSLTNWAAGGEGSIALNGMGNFSLTYKEGKNEWQNKLELAYGLVKVGEGVMKKSDDKIYFESKYGRRATEKLDWTAMFSFRSQFVKGFEYPENADKVLLSNLLAPAYINLSVGINWKPVSYFSAFFSPASPKFTIVNDQVLSDRGSFGVTPGEKTRFEFGGLAKFNFKKDILKNVNLASNLELYSNYLESPQNIDIRWDVVVFMKINSFLTANVTTNLLYDDDIMITDAEGKVGPRVQLKEILGVGLTFKF
ncbi:MAG: hypothetical protein CSA95_06475 [Bacteroidetes bacterium]|nr:MAG: hypothetical protein CSA95_06475 [Bacteroidota bacterium]